jgi:hypothetical protein
VPFSADAAAEQSLTLLRSSAKKGEMLLCPFCAAGLTNNHYNVFLLYFDLTMPDNFFFIKIQ